MVHFWHGCRVDVKVGAAERVGSSAIRDLLEVTARPEIISMAGGLPCPDAFPVEAIAAATDAALADRSALQYAETPGYGPLREWVAARHDVVTEQVVITHGSQQALELLVRAVTEPGDVIALADPGYVGAVQAFRLNRARLVGIASDRDGMRVDDLADRLADGLRPTIVYVVANFDNPTGATLSDERRASLAGLADRYGFLVVDDDPYGELRWSGQAVASLASMSTRVVTLGTTSKVICPGLRVGWAVAPAAIGRDVGILKQAVDLQTTTLTQRIAHHVLTQSGFLTSHVQGLQVRYRQQCAALATALRAELGDRLSFSEPDGGMFLWGRVRGVDTSELLASALENGVAFVPGGAFGVEAKHRDALRLSFATSTCEELVEGARRLTSTLLGWTSATVSGSRVSAT